MPEKDLVKELHQFWDIEFPRMQAELARLRAAIEAHKLCTDGKCDHSDLDSIGFDSETMEETVIKYKCDMMDADNRLYAALNPKEQ